jgi:hypothetical protein
MQGIRLAALAAAAIIVANDGNARAECFQNMALPHPLMLYADGITISFVPEPTNDYERRYGPSEDTLIPQVMKLGCHYNPKTHPKISWPVDQKNICEGTKIVIDGQSCSIDSISAAKLNDLPDVEWFGKIDESGNSGIWFVPWLAGWRIHKH